MLPDLIERYDAVLEAVEAADGWATSVRASRPPATIMGRLGGVEAGLRQLRRTRPLETVEIALGEGITVVAPTETETLRVKAYLVVQRRAVRDFLDVAALAEHLGHGTAVETLSAIDEYYDDRSNEDGSVLTALTIGLAAPNPADPQVIGELDRYKNLDERRHDWSNVVSACEHLALGIGGVT